MDPPVPQLGNNTDTFSGISIHFIQSESRIQQIGCLSGLKQQWTRRKLAATLHFQRIYLALKDNVVWGKNTEMQYTTFECVCWSCTNKHWRFCWMCTSSMSALITHRDVWVPNNSLEGDSFKLLTVIAVAFIAFIYSKNSKHCWQGETENYTAVSEVLVRKFPRRSNK